MGIRQHCDALDRMAKVGPKAAAAGRSATLPAPSPLLSVASVAEIVGLSKSELREVVQRPEFAQRIRYSKLTTDGKSGRSIRIPRDLVDEIRAATRRADNAPPTPEDNPRSAESGAQFGSGNPEMSLAIVYERLLAEKDSRIADLRAEIEHLRAVLEREQTGHARAQALLSLHTAPPAIAEIESESADEPVGESIALDLDDYAPTFAPVGESDLPECAPVAAESADVDSPVSIVETVGEPATVSELPAVIVAKPEPRTKRPFWKFWDWR
jgi:uncharacterized small protein (DUF1192 family)